MIARKRKCFIGLLKEKGWFYCFFMAKEPVSPNHFGEVPKALVEDSSGKMLVVHANLVTFGK